MRKMSIPRFPAKTQRRNLRKYAKSNSFGSNWQKTSTMEITNWQKKIPQNSFDKRYPVKTANRFEIFKNDTEETHSQQGNRGNENLRNDALKPLPQNPLVRLKANISPSHQFFKVDQLDNQIRIFNLTRYAHPEKYKALAPDSYQAVSIQAGNFAPQAASPGSYIPPHRRRKDPHNSVNPSPPPRASLRYTKEEPAKISSKAIESAWEKCSKGGLFAVWNGPQEDFPLLLDWLGKPGKYLHLLRKHTILTMFK